MDNCTSPFLYEERPVPNKNQDRQTLNQVCQAETNMIATLLKSSYQTILNQTICHQSI